MRERQLDDLGDFRHGAKNRRYAGQCRNRYAFATLSERGKPGLGHDRIANPLRRDDQRAHHRHEKRCEQRSAPAGLSDPTERSRRL